MTYSYDDKEELPDEKTLNALRTDGQAAVKKVRELASKLSGLVTQRELLKSQNANLRAHIHSVSAVVSDLTRANSDDLPVEGEKAKQIVVNLSNRRDEALSKLSRIESGLGVEGVSLKEAVTPSSGPTEDVHARWKQIEDDERSGKAAPGASIDFYRKNKKALRQSRPAQDR